MNQTEESKEEYTAVGQTQTRLGVKPGEFAAAARIRELLEGLERYAANVTFLVNNGYALESMRRWVTEIDLQIQVLEALRDEWKKN